ncbi:hypothetical protein [Pseudomonas sp. NPDC089734]|uniref:hypothetical protein n=1 Tax=Pseudomonas sp. NPDC089734 TaxID=3364469 RepID=UPI003806C9DC
MHCRKRVLTLATACLMSCTLLAQAAPARYYKWQGQDMIICAQTSPGPGWKRLNGSFVKSDCSI